MAWRESLLKADPSLQATVQMAAIQLRDQQKMLVGEMPPGGVVPLNGTVLILNDTMGGQIPAVFYTLKPGDVFSQRQCPLLLRVVQIEAVASTAVFSAIAVAVYLANDRIDLPVELKIDGKRAHSLCRLTLFLWLLRHNGPDQSVHVLEKLLRTPPAFGAKIL